jgi:hypothetical protein
VADKIVGHFLKAAPSSMDETIEEALANLYSLRSPCYP